MKKEKPTFVNGFNLYPELKPMSDDKIDNIFNIITDLINLGKKKFFISDQTVSMHIGKHQIDCDDIWNKEVRYIEKKSKLSKKMSKAIFKTYFEECASYLIDEGNGYYKLKYKNEDYKYKVLINPKYHFDNVSVINNRIFFFLDLVINVEFVGSKSIKK